MRRKPLAIWSLLTVTALIGSVSACSSDSSSGASGSPSASASTGTTVDPAQDPATWSTDRLAAHLVLAGINMSELSYAKAWAHKGIGGIVLFDAPPATLKEDLTAVREAAPDGRLLISSDEEGGLVQRLSSVIGPLPSAKKLAATKSPSQVNKIATAYGSKMKALGVNVDLAPVADLATPGGFIAKDNRAFSANPATVIKYSVAWMSGMEAAGVMPVIKHWPGHGGASDTHIGSGRTPSWSQLQQADATTFKAAFAKGAPAVLVGHLIVPGLTESNVPASMSKKALHKLRSIAGPDVLIMTDSLSMGAVTTSMKQTEKQAALRSLMAGADMALLQSTATTEIINSIAAAINAGTYPRPQAIASAKRVLAAQTKWS